MRRANTPTALPADYRTSSWVPSRARANVNAMKLKAFKCYYAPAGALGVAGHSGEADA
jgi:hypothetical protein